ncbi:hypothetical protein QQF64_019368 [Cirrhinus molitorella]|uniref:Uncharacterized protein n=1 Tax=Cirrhinus molitorella TaxID=172907 RepID=A0ABR3LF95_9TELE
MNTGAFEMPKRSCSCDQMEPIDGDSVEQNFNALCTDQQVQCYANSCRVEESKQELVHEDRERCRDKQQAACLKLYAGTYHANPSNQSADECQSNGFAFEHTQH